MTNKANINSPDDLVYQNLYDKFKALSDAEKTVIAIQLGWGFKPTTGASVLVVYQLRIPNFGAPIGADPFELNHFPTWSKEGTEIVGKFYGKYGLRIKETA